MADPKRSERMQSEMADHEVVLSEAGATRKAEMLEALTGAMETFHRRRRRRRRWSAIAALVLLIGSAIWAATAVPGRPPERDQSVIISDRRGGDRADADAGDQTTLSNDSTTVDASRGVASASSTEDLTVIEPRPLRFVKRIESSANVSAMRIRPTGLVRYIDDEELLQLLASMDRPTGLVRIGDRAWLTREVTDEPADREGG